jgi:ribonuclease P protein component
MLLDENCHQPHVGYALGRKVGSAVRRNRLRRQLRELVNTHRDELRPGWYVMGASPKATNYSYSELSEEINILVRKCTKVGVS